MALVDSPLGKQSQESLEAQKRRSILLAQKKDAELALDWFEGPAYARISERYEAILLNYEQLLHDVGASSAQRDNAAWAVHACKRLISVKEEFETQLKRSIASLAELDSNGQASSNLWERLFTFVR